MFDKIAKEKVLALLRDSVHNLGIEVIVFSEETTEEYTHIEEIKTCLEEDEDVYINVFMTGFSAISEGFRIFDVYDFNASFIHEMTAIDTPDCIHASFVPRYNKET